MDPPHGTACQVAVGAPRCVDIHSPSCAFYEGKQRRAHRVWIRWPGCRQGALRGLCVEPPRFDFGRKRDEHANGVDGRWRKRDDARPSDEITSSTIAFGRDEDHVGKACDVDAFVELVRGRRMFRDERFAFVRHADACEDARTFDGRGDAYGLSVIHEHGGKRTTSKWFAPGSAGCMQTAAALGAKIRASAIDKPHGSGPARRRARERREGSFGMISGIEDVGQERA